MTSTKTPLRTASAILILSASLHAWPMEEQKQDRPDICSENPNRMNSIPSTVNLTQSPREGTSVSSSETTPSSVGTTSEGVSVRQASSNSLFRGLLKWAIPSSSEHQVQNVPPAFDLQREASDRGLDPNALREYLEVVTRTDDSAEHQTAFDQIVAKTNQQRPENPMSPRELKALENDLVFLATQFVEARPSLLGISSSLKKADSSLPARKLSQEEQREEILRLAAINVNKVRKRDQLEPEHILEAHSLMKAAFRPLPRPENITSRNFIYRAFDEVDLNMIDELRQSFLKKAGIALARVKSQPGTERVDTLLKSAAEKYKDAAVKAEELFNIRCTHEPSIDLLGDSGLTFSLEYMERKFLAKIEFFPALEEAVTLERAAALAEHATALSQTEPGIAREYSDFADLLVECSKAREHTRRNLTELDLKKHDISLDILIAEESQINALTLDDKNEYKALVNHLDYLNKALDEFLFNKNDFSLVTVKDLVRHIKKQGDVHNPSHAVKRIDESITLLKDDAPSFQHSTAEKKIIPYLITSLYYQRAMIFYRTARLRPYIREEQNTAAENSIVDARKAAEEINDTGLGIDGMK